MRKSFTDAIEGQGIEPKAAFKKFWTRYTTGRKSHKPAFPRAGWVEHQAQQLKVKPDADGQISSPELTRAYVREYESVNHLKATK